MGVWGCRGRFGEGCPVACPLIFAETGACPPLFLQRHNTLNKSQVCNIHVTWSRGVSHMSAISSIKNATFWSKPHINRISSCRDMDDSLKFLNNVKHKNLSPLLVYNSKSTFLTPDSFPWSCHIMYYIYLYFQCSIYQFVPVLSTLEPTK